MIDPNDLVGNVGIGHLKGIVNKSGPLDVYDDDGKVVARLTEVWTEDTDEGTTYRGTIQYLEDDTESEVVLATRVKETPDD